MPAHIDRSKPEVFDSVIAAFGEYLKIKNVVVIEDPERGIIRTQDMMSPQSMANLAKDATADSFLRITVDRPVAAWLKVTVSAFDISGTKLWEESASEGGGLTGKNAVQKTMAKLKPKLDHHVGQPGLPVKT